MMENQNELDEPLDQRQSAKVELEKHLPEWFLLLRRLVVEYLNKHSPPTDEANANTVPAEGHGENKPVEVNV